MEKWLIREEHYAQDMDNIVWPYLNERKKEFRLKTADGKALAVYNYHADNPKQVVVISHGFTETAHKYAEVIYYFLLHGYEVYMPEHCGHGKSYRMTKDPCKVHVDTYNRYISDLLKVVSYAKKKHADLPLTLFGHSMGGGIAGVAAGRKPKWFDRVVLSSPMIQPNTNGIPWPIIKLICRASYVLGKSEAYVFGHGPYKGKEDFASSASKSKARFAYYQEYRLQELSAQMSGASFSWLWAAAGIHKELMKESYKNLKMPLLLIQAGSDQSVRNDAQDHFMEKLKAEPGSQAVMFQIPGTKHEIFNAGDKTVNEYWRLIFN